MQAPLSGQGLTSVRAVRIATAGALLGRLVTHGVSPELVVVSEGAPPFDVLVPASCWLHAERPLHRLVPFCEAHRQAIEGVRQPLWALYQALKAYREQPEAARQPGLAAQFDELCAKRTGYPSVDGVLAERAAHKADLLRVLEQPEVPLHNNVAESALREDGTKRKIPRLAERSRRRAGVRCGGGVVAVPA
jgi:hypothetical protein